MYYKYLYCNQFHSAVLILITLPYALRYTVQSVTGNHGYRSVLYTHILNIYLF